MLGRVGCSIESGALLKGHQYVYLSCLGNPRHDPPVLIYYAPLAFPAIDEFIFHAVVATPHLCNPSEGIYTFAVLGYTTDATIAFVSITANVFDRSSLVERDCHSYKIVEMLAPRYLYLAKSIDTYIVAFEADFGEFYVLDTAGALESSFRANWIRLEGNCGPCNSMDVIPSSIVRDETQKLISCDCILLQSSVADLIIGKIDFVRFRITFESISSTLSECQGRSTCIVNNKVFVVGGVSYEDTVNVFDISTREWLDPAPFSDVAFLDRTQPGICRTGRYVIVAGGFSNEPITRPLVYDLLQLKWIRPSIGSRMPRFSVDPITEILNPLDPISAKRGDLLISISFSHDNFDIFSPLLIYPFKVT